MPDRPLRCLDFTAPQPALIGAARTAGGAELAGSSTVGNSSVKKLCEAANLASGRAGRRAMVPCTIGIGIPIVVET